jgi:hypothetical protein
MQVIKVYGTQIKLGHMASLCRKIAVNFWITPAEDNTPLEAWYCVCMLYQDYMRFQKAEKMEVYHE